MLWPSAGHGKPTAPPNKTAGGVERSMKMPNAGEIIERLARESERQKIEIEALKRQVAELENQLAQKG